MKESHNKSHEPKEEMKTIHDEKGIKESHMKRKQVIMKKVQRNSWPKGGSWKGSHGGLIYNANVVRITQWNHNNTQINAR